MVCRQLEALQRQASLRDELECFWGNPENQRARTWSGHRDIDEVMLAMSLAPEGFLALHPPARPSGVEEEP